MNYVFIDLMTCIHQLTFSIQESERLELVLDFIPFIARPYLYIYPENPIGMETIGVTVVGLLDMKNENEQYWRHQLFPKYKSGRAEKTALLRFVRDSVLKSWRKFDLPLVSQVGFEADDWVGYLVSQMQPEDRAAMITVDGDWAQLVSERVMWLDTFPTQKRTGESQKCPVLGVKEVIARINGHKDYRNMHSSKHIKKPSDIVDLKWEFGDSSDRIPKGRVVDRGIIDLVNPTLKIPNPPLLSDFQMPKPPTLSNVGMKCSDFGLPDWYGYGKLKSLTPETETETETTNEPN